MAHFKCVWLFLLLISEGWSLEKKEDKQEKVPKSDTFVQGLRTELKDMEADLIEVAEELKKLKMEDYGRDSGAYYFTTKTGRCTSVGYYDCKAIAGPDIGDDWIAYSKEVPGGCYKYAPDGKFYFNKLRGAECGANGGDECYCKNPNACEDKKDRGHCKYWMELGYCMSYQYSRFMNDECCATCAARNARDCKWSKGTDGVGGSEIKIVGYVVGHADCAEKCRQKKEQYKDIRGATFRPRDNKCWCEFMMKAREKNEDYDSCFFVSVPHGTKKSSETKYPGDGPCSSDGDCYGKSICGANNCDWGSGTDNCCEGINYGGDGCSPSDPCGPGNGDCDKDADCEEGSVCGNDNCAWAGAVESDCCQKLRCHKEDGCCTSTNKCERGEGYCSSDSHCVGDMKCNNKICGGTNYGESGCSKDDPCNPGNGDCDRDSQCAGEAVCGYDNCAWGGKDDCCILGDRVEQGTVTIGWNKSGGRVTGWRCQGQERKRSNGYMGRCCYERDRCGPGDGDCDYDDECIGDLKCGSSNCRWGGNDDCCYDPENPYF